MTELVTVFRPQNRNGVFHTTECEVIRNRDGGTAKYKRKGLENLGYEECSKCKGEYPDVNPESWRPSLRELIRTEKVETTDEPDYIR